MRRQKKKFYACRIALGLFTTALILGGCGKTRKFTGGEDIGYPYHCEIKSDGTVTITFDGSATPDAQWTVLASDDGTLEVKEKKAEKKGKITYVITPYKEGNTEVVFQRIKPEKETTDDSEDTAMGSDNAAPDEEYGTAGDDDEDDVGEDDIDGDDDTSDSDIKPEYDIEIDDSEFEDYPVPEADYVPVYEIKMKSSNIICSVSLSFNIKESGKKNKFITDAYTNNEHLTEGVLSGDDDSVIDYEAWIDESYTLQVKLPFVNSGWEYAHTSNYVKVEYEEAVGVTFEEPEPDENGDINIVDVCEYGEIEGYEFFVVYGLANGDATVVFTDKAGAYRLTLILKVDENGHISLESNKMERIG